MDKKSDRCHKEKLTTIDHITTQPIPYIALSTFARI